MKIRYLSQPLVVQTLRSTADCNQNLRANTFVMINNRVTDIRRNAVLNHRCRVQHRDARKDIAKPPIIAHTPPPRNIFFSSTRPLARLAEPILSPAHQSQSHPNARCKYVICSDHPTVNVLERRRSRLVGKSVHL